MITRCIYLVFAYGGACFMCYWLAFVTSEVRNAVLDWLEHRHALYSLPNISVAVALADIGRNSNTFLVYCSVYALAWWELAYVSGKIFAHPDEAHRLAILTPFKGGLLASIVLFAGIVSMICLPILRYAQSYFFHVAPERQPAIVPVMLLVSLAVIVSLVLVGFWREKSGTKRSDDEL